ncbi:hypothetical protein D1007_51299 [Hordeum vulgare]|nr:hypothetical protein D1007_51299 [Hordeum vulgare]
MELTDQELISRFKKSNHLDRQDMIMFSGLENIDKTKPVIGNHYWIFNVNISDRRFEVLDSWRTLKNNSLDVCARKIVASLRVMWKEHYARSHISLDEFGLISIDVPQQDNENSWEGRVVPKFTVEVVPNMRKHLTNSWVDNVYNNAPWKAILNIAKITASSALRKCM